MSGFFRTLGSRKTSVTDQRVIISANILDLPSTLSEAGDAGNMAYSNDSIYYRNSSGWVPLFSANSLIGGNGITITSQSNSSIINLSRRLVPATTPPPLPSVLGSPLVVNGDPALGDYVIRNLSAANGLAVTSNSVAITTRLTQELNSVGNGESIVVNSNPLSGNYSIKSFTSSNGVVITASPSSIDIGYARQLVDASNIVAANTASIISQPLPSSDFSLKKIAAGENISLTDSAGVITLSYEPSPMLTLTRFAAMFAIQFPSSAIKVPNNISPVVCTLRKIGRVVHVDINANQWTFDEPIGKYAMFFPLIDIPLEWMPSYGSAIVTETGFFDTTAGSFVKGRFGITASAHISTDNPPESFVDPIIFSAPLSFSALNTIDVYIGVGKFFDTAGPRIGLWDGYFNTPAGISWITQS